MSLAQFFAWFVPLLIVAGYAVGAYALRHWLVERFDRPGEIESRAAEELVGRALGWPLVALLALGGAALLVGLWPLSPPHASFLFAVLRLALIGLAVALALMALRIYAEHGGEDSLLANRAVAAMARGALFFFAVLFAIQVLGLGVLPAVILFAALALMVALAMRDAFGNFFAGICLSLDRPIHKGDIIRLATGEMGRVEMIGWTSTRLASLQGSALHVPNRKLLDGTIATLSRGQAASLVEARVMIAADASLEKAKKSAGIVARAVQRAESEFAGEGEPAISVESISADGIALRIAIPARNFAAAGPLRDALLTALAKRFQSDKIHFAGRSNGSTRDAAASALAETE